MSMTWHKAEHGVLGHGWRQKRLVPMHVLCRYTSDRLPCRAKEWVLHAWLMLQMTGKHNAVPY